jgi:hypothetical protein
MSEATPEAIEEKEGHTSGDIVAFEVCHRSAWRGDEKCCCNEGTIKRCYPKKGLRVDIVHLEKLR